MKAFPSNGFYERTTGGEQPTKIEPIMGMDLRDYFAGQALMSMLSPVQDISESTPKQAAELSYKFADAMMEARKK